MLLYWKNTAKMATPSKAIYRFNAIPRKIPVTRTRTNSTKTYMELQKKKKTNGQSNSEEKEKKPGGINLPNFKQYYEAIIIKTAWFWHQKQT